MEEAIIRNITFKKKIIIKKMLKTMNFSIKTTCNFIVLTKHNIPI